jgi:hypothetical protein
MSTNSKQWQPDVEDPDGDEDALLTPEESKAAARNSKALMDHLRRTAPHRVHSTRHEHWRKKAVRNLMRS